MKRVLFSAPFAFGIRNFVATGLCARAIAELGDAVVLSPFPDEHLSSPDGTRVRNLALPAQPGEWGLPVPSQVTRWDRIWKYIHMFGFAQEYPHGSLTTMSMAANRKHAAWWVARGLRALAPRGSAMRDRLRRLNQGRHPRRAMVGEYFDKENPDLVVVTSPGHFWSDQFALEEAIRRKIPTLCVVMSWDNLYSRGPLIRRPDRLAVWSEAMRKQAETVHDFPPDRIDEVGALQFGYYAEPPTLREGEAMRARIGLRPEERYIAYVCGSRTARYDVEDVLAMIDALRGTEFESLEIVLRPHPQGQRTVYSELPSRGVLLDLSPDITSAKQRPDAVNKTEIRHMAAFLGGADFVVSSWGTTALLEATLLDRPTVQFRWMDSVRHSVPEEVQKVRDFQLYLHMKDFDAPAARLYSDAPGDLPSRLRHLLQHREDFDTRRKSLIRRIVKLPLDKCVDRVLDVCRLMVGSN